MEIKEYTVNKDGRIQGVWCNNGETIKLNDLAAKYPSLSGQISLKTKKTTGKDK